MGWCAKYLIEATAIFTILCKAGAHLKGEDKGLSSWTPVLMSQCSEREITVTRTTAWRLSAIPSTDLVLDPPGQGYPWRPWQCRGAQGHGPCYQCSWIVMVLWWSWVRIIMALLACCHVMSMIITPESLVLPRLCAMSLPSWMGSSLAWPQYCYHF